MFTFKAIVGTLLSPSVAMGLLGLAAAALLLIPRARRAAAWTLAGLAVAAFLLGTRPVADFLIAPLETRYPQVHDPRFLGEEISWVVVLGGGAASDARVAPPARLTGESLYRVVEGVRLWRMLPEARLHFSGWGAADTVSTAEAFANAARALGVPDEAIVTAPEPRDTGEEARAVARRIAAGEPFLLVTGAAHLPRAVRHFEAQGLRPIPAPAHVYSLERPRLRPRDFLPDPENHQKVDRAVHEYLGITWAWLTGAR